MNGDDGRWCRELNSFIFIRGCRQIARSLDGLRHPLEVLLEGIRRHVLHYQHSVKDPFQLVRLGSIAAGHTDNSAANSAADNADSAHTDSDTS